MAVLKTTVDDTDDHTAPVEGRVESRAGLHAVDVGRAPRRVEQRGVGAARGNAEHADIGGQAAQGGGVGTERHEVLAEGRGEGGGVVGGEALGIAGLDEHVGEGLAFGGVAAQGVGTLFEEERVERGVDFVEVEALGSVVRAHGEAVRGAGGDSVGGTAGAEKETE